MIKFWNSLHEVLIIDYTHYITNKQSLINFELFTILYLNYIGNTFVVCIFSQ